MQNSDRSVTDTRHPQCKAQHYDVASLPATSVIVCFHNEARSTLLRTVRSVIMRTPSSLLVEVGLLCKPRSGVRRGVWLRHTSLSGDFSR